MVSSCLHSVGHIVRSGIIHVVFLTQFSSFLCSMDMCNHHILEESILEHSLTSKRNPIPLAITSVSFPPLSPKQSQNRLSVSIDLPILNISYAWNVTICSFLCLPSFAYNIFKVHPCCSGYNASFPFYGQIYSIVRIFHILFIYSSLAGTIVLFPSLALLWIILL